VRRVSLARFQPVREVGLDTTARPWRAEYPVEDLDRSAQGDPIVFGGEQENEAHNCPIQELGLDKILKRFHVETLAKLLPLAELLGASAATLSAVFAGELVRFGAVLEQVNAAVGTTIGTGATLGSPSGARWPPIATL
jgi:hypothetical protein